MRKSKSAVSYQRASMKAALKQCIESSHLSLPLNVFTYCQECVCVCVCVLVLLVLSCLYVHFLVSICRIQMDTNCIFHFAQANSFLSALAFYLFLWKWQKPNKISLNFYRSPGAPIQITSRAWHCPPHTTSACTLTYAKTNWHQTQIHSHLPPFGTCARVTCTVNQTIATIWCRWWELSVGWRANSVIRHCTVDSILVWASDQSRTKVVIVRFHLIKTAELVTLGNTANCSIIDIICGYFGGRRSKSIHPLEQ